MDVYRDLSDALTKHRVVSFLQHLKKHDLTLNQYSILSWIDQQGPALPVQLAEHLELKAASITYLVDALEQKGLVYRKPNPRDGRSHYVDHTEAGHALVLDKRNEGDDRIMSIFRAMDDEELDMLYVMMKLLRRKLFR
ncbi:MarR family transcriptional regulator [Paenibacillus lemnae]|uniref:MarR family transcriptional regulator n=2 Tax=Paenibacillus lemnae TaxID=1330551 RepID=A0A848MDL4_PAELE|nr:MarR family transcriptional regulator [Paenibacillus lemnae]